MTTVDVGAVIDPNDSAANALVRWAVFDTSGTKITDRSFANADQTFTADWSNNNGFVFKAGVDINNDGVLATEEMAHTINLARRTLTLTTSFRDNGVTDDGVSPAANTVVNQGTPAKPNSRPISVFANENGVRVSAKLSILSSTFPAGLTAVLSPQEAGGAYPLTFTATSTAAPGYYRVLLGSTEDPGLSYGIFVQVK